MNTKNCRICKNCEYYKPSIYHTGMDCTAAPKIRIDPIRGIESYSRDCSKRNKNMDCLWFRKKKKKLVVENSIPPKKSWWTRFIEVLFRIIGVD